ncbi:hypothetical protein ACFL16_00845 [Patescibacteria group bacterium]
MKKNIIEWGLCFVITVLAIFSWGSVNKIILNGEAENWSLSIVLIACLVSFLYAFLVAVSNRVIIFMGLACVFLVNLFFVPSLNHLIFLVIAYFVAVLVYLISKREMGIIVPIEIWRIARPSRVLMVLAITLTITSQYHYSTLGADAAGALPEIKLGKTESRIAANLLSVFSSDFEGSNLENATVDEFLLDQMKKSVGQDDESAIAEGAGVLLNEEVLLSDGRSRFSEMVGREISGDESALDVFGELINIEINKFFTTKLKPETIVLIPWAIFIFLFFMIFSISSFLMPLIVMFSKLIFFILVKSKLVELKHVQVEKEVVV